MAEGAQAAPPLLGSTLLKLAENEDGRRPSPASCGCAAIDQMALEGGFRYGEITSIAGAAGTGKTLVRIENAIMNVVYKMYLLSSNQISLPTSIYTFPYKLQKTGKDYD